LPGSPNASEASQAGFHVGAPPLVLDQLGGGTFEIANREGGTPSTAAFRHPLMAASATPTT
jgi:hypothetical protein